MQSFYHMLLTEVLLTGHFSLSEPVLMFISNIDTAVSRERLKALLFKKKKKIEMDTVNH